MTEVMVHEFAKTKSSATRMSGKPGGEMARALNPSGPKPLSQSQFSPPGMQHAPVSSTQGSSAQSVPIPWNAPPSFPQVVGSVFVH